ncbi:unnamed protein product [Staurois parvus]|uniref:Cytochrome c oxidase subunit 7A1, mitochondrial n=1 Tax=Staurois parvus TaxID=386267 RepID=A0ABN9B5P5_9NEOB|nr:unnamed protein product [Staurois parvus]
MITWLWRVWMVNSIDGRMEEGQWMVLGQRISRSLSTSSRVHLQNHVLEKQKIFQADNNLPVHLKGGKGDLILYRITMGISIVGCCLSVYTLVKASLPKK